MWGRGNCVLGFLVFFFWSQLSDFAKNISPRLFQVKCWWENYAGMLLKPFWQADALPSVWLLICKLLFCSICWCIRDDSKMLMHSCYSAEEDRPRVGGCAILVCTATRLQVRMMSRAVNELILLGVRCYCDNTVILCYCATVILLWCYCDTTVILLWC